MNLSRLALYGQHGYFSDALKGYVAIETATSRLRVIMGDREHVATLIAEAKQTAKSSPRWTAAQLIERIADDFATSRDYDRALRVAKGLR